MGRLLRGRKKGRKSVRHKAKNRELEWIDFDRDYESEEYDEEEEYEFEDEYEETDEYGEEEYEEEYEDEYDYESEEYEEDEYESEEEYDEADEYDEEEYEDEYDYEDEDYEEEDYEEDEVPAGGIGKIVYKLTNLSSVDYIVALTGVAVLVLAVITGTLYFSAKEEKAQIEAFAEIGVGLEDISMIGEGGLVAVADAQAARSMAAEVVEEMEEQDEEEEEKKGDKEAILNLASIQKDLKIREKSVHLKDSAL